MDNLNTQSMSDDLLEKHIDGLYKSKSLITEQLRDLEIELTHRKAGCGLHDVVEYRGCQYFVERFVKWGVWLSKIKKDGTPGSRCETCHLYTGAGWAPPLTVIKKAGT